MDANQAYQLETNIDWYNIIFTLGAHPIYQKRLHICLHPRQSRVLFGQGTPSGERQQRLSCAGRTRIHRVHLLLGGAVEKEREINRQGQVLPFRV